MDSCSIGAHCGQEEDCHKTTYTKNTGILKLLELPLEKRQLLLRRSNFKNQDSTTTVCYHHEKLFLGKYSFLQKACCDPFRLHADSSRKKSLRAINLQTADQISSITGSNVHPGQKLCPMCRMHSQAHSEPSEESDEDNMDYLILVAGPSREDATAISSLAEQAVGNMSTSLTEAGFSPVKVIKASRRDEVGDGKRKAAEAKEAAVSHLSTGLQIPPAIFDNSGMDRQGLIDALKNKMIQTVSKQNLFTW
ncbi:ARL14 effector protein [Acipenser ruthenus]|uniref:ARL14 effector protein n=1 Tax=Acipenser ruthenus TaxID=7906 RepID=A0A444V1X4_ACIRT|nr:ARL14 effector protein [Acipenser ruthenus]